MSKKVICVLILNLMWACQSFASTEVWEQKNIYDYAFILKYPNQWKIWGEQRKQEFVKEGATATLELPCEENDECGTITVTLFEPKDETFKFIISNSIQKWVENTETVDNPLAKSLSFENHGLWSCVTKEYRKLSGLQRVGISCYTLRERTNGRGPILLRAHLFEMDKRRYDPKAELSHGDFYKADAALLKLKDIFIGIMEKIDVPNQKNIYEQFDCGFAHFKHIQDFMKFYPEAKSYLKGQEEDDKRWEGNWSSIDVREVGLVTNGPCKGAKVIVGTSVYNNACGKGGDDGPSVYSTSGMPVKPPNIWDDVGGCDVSVRFLVLGDKAIFPNYRSAEDGYYALKNLNPALSVLYDEGSDYQKFFSGVIKHKNKSLEFAPHKEGFVDERKFNIGLKNYLGTDKNAGKVYYSDQKGFLVANDHTVMDVDLGLEITPAGYAFAGIVTETKALKKKLAKLDSDPDFSKIKDTKDKYLKNEYRAYMSRVEDSNAQAKSHYSQEDHTVKPLSYDEFVDETPVLFAEDNLGRLQSFGKLLHEFPAWSEPLLYVYSSRPVAMKISYGPNVDVLVSRPNYDDGWDIVTHPPDQVRELRTGHLYSKLFWEGSTLIIPPLKQGWSVRPRDISKLLDRELKIRGLNAVEITDFKNYWLPKMKKAPFYRIEFLPDDWIRDICPLSLTPVPETLVRVHMRVYALRRYIPSNPPIIKKIVKRSGLTVVEWGGIMGGSYGL